MFASADVAWLPASLAAFVSYLPIALYAESLKLGSVLVCAISNETTVPRPTTGCVKDITRIWNLSPHALLGGFSGHGPVVASRRHGNTFPLVNKTVLEGAGLIGRSRDEVHIDDTVPRPTTVHITFAYLRTAPSRSKHLYLRRLILSLEIGTLIALSILLFEAKMAVGALLLDCIAANLLLLWIIQDFTSLIYANAQALAKDMQQTTARGAATDVHVIVQDWNASAMDVIIGYSSQLHALTNISVRIRRWKVVKWTTRALIVVLTIQAALLGSLIGRSDKEVLGGAVWLCCYFILQIPPTVLQRLHPDAMLNGQSTTLERIPPLVFSGRRVALAFIGSLPMTDSRAGDWDWLEGFMPRNERRKQWEAELVTGGLSNALVDEELGPQIEHSTTTLLQEIKSVKSNKALKTAMESFTKTVNLR